MAHDPTDPTHSHSHGHSHAPASFGRAFAIGISLNLMFVVIEAVYGVLSHSLALIADAGHNFSDVIGLVLAWLTTWLAARRPTREYTYGFKSTTILSALANAMFLLVAIGGIAWEAIRRLQNPGAVEGRVVMIVAAIGIAVNTGTALLFLSGRHSDLNIRGAFLHMAADALVSVGVVLGGFALLRTGWTWIDPVLSLIVSVVIVFGTLGLLRDSFRLAVHAVPRGVDLMRVLEFLKRQPGVEAVHDLHIWGMSTTENALTAHLVMPRAPADDPFLQALAQQLKSEFGIHHSTFQVERDDCGDDCGSQQE